MIRKTENKNVNKHLQYKHFKDINEEKQYEYLNKASYMNLKNYHKIHKKTVENNVKKRCLYDEQDLDNNTKKNAKRRCLYQEDLENNCVKQIQRYNKNLEKCK